MQYVRIAGPNTFKNAKLIPETYDIFKSTSRNSAWYQSMYYFKPEHKEKFDKTKSVAGITDVDTNKIWWDFDAKDISDARESTITLVKRLKELGFTDENLQIKFSGGKGYHVVINLNEKLNPNEVKTICKNIAGDLPGFDTKVYNATRLLRIPLTKHEETKLYAKPITVNELIEYDANQIVEFAKNISDIDPAALEAYYKTAKLPTKIYEIKNEAPKMTTTLDRDLQFDWKDLDMSKKPNFLDNARWALQNGFFYGSASKDNGDRNSAFLCLAATYKNMGWQPEHTWRILKGVAEIQAKRTGENEFDENELWNNIIMCVYGPSWKGGQFSIHDEHSWLYQYVKEYNIPIEEQEEELKPVTIGQLTSGFTDFAKNLENNIVKTGLDDIDRTMPVLCGMNLGIIGSAGSGKSSLMLKIAENTSKAGTLSVMASIDMARNRMYHKLAMKESGLSQMEVIELFRDNPDEAMKISTRIAKKYGNVWFYDRSYATISSIRDYIKQVEKATGEKVKLVMLDYFERLNVDVSDDTAASKRISGQIQDMVNDLNVACITFVQPNKFSLNGGPNTPILNYTSIKGSSFLYQSFRSILSLWRPFYSPDTKEHDNYMQMAILKNDLGELAQFDYGWNGRKGEIYPLEDIDRQQLKELLSMQEEQKNESNQFKNKGF